MTRRSALLVPLAPVVGLLTRLTTQPRIAWGRIYNLFVSVGSRSYAFTHQTAPEIHRGIARFSGRGGMATIANRATGAMHSLELQNLPGKLRLP